MKYSLSVFLVLFCCSLSLAQLKYDKKVYNFGRIAEESKLVVDFKITNVGDEKILLLRAQGNRNTIVRVSKKSLDPNESILVRVKYLPASEGRFAENVTLYFSNSMEATILSIKGNVAELPNDVSPSCPDFDTPISKEEKQSFYLTVNVRDSMTYEPIHKARVQILATGLPNYKFQTDRKGKVVEKVRIGYYFFHVSAPGYFPEEFDAYVNRKRNTIDVFLAKKRIKNVPVPEEPLPIVEESITITNEGKLEEEVLEEPKEEIEIVIGENKPIEPSKEELRRKKLKEIPLNELPEEYFKPNNVVFLLDVSKSMKAYHKIDLLKSSMIELANVLRTIDQMSIVSFANNAEVLMEPVNGDEKKEMNRVINQLKANGNTMGAEGIHKAYKMAEKSFLPNANNIVILVTDGAFNGGSKYKELIAEKAMKGIYISTVGIKSSPMDQYNLKTIAKKGRGTYVHISTTEDAKENLIREIRRGSFKQ